MSQGVHDRPALTPELQEAMERGKQDIVFFAYYFLGIKLHPGQIRFLRGANGIVNILVPGNRFGKTVILAVRHIWHCFYKIGLYEGDGEDWAKAEYKTAALAPSGEVLEVMHRTIVQIMRGAFVISREGEPIKTNYCRIGWFMVPEKNRNSAPYYIQFQDNTHIKFHSSSDDKFSSVQGKKYGYGGYDEGGRTHHLEYELKSNLIPRFQELNAPLDLASTPDQKSPSIVYHHEIFQKGLRHEDGFLSFEGAADENVYLTKSYFEGIEKSLGDDPLYAQVRYGKFVFAGDTLYKQEDIQRAITKDLNGGERWQPGLHYGVGTDTALLTDEMVHTVLAYRPTETPLIGTRENPLRLVWQAAAPGRAKSPEVHTFDYLNLWEHYNQGGTASGVIECFNSDGIRFWMDLPRQVRRKHKHYAWSGPEGAKVANQGNNSFKKSEPLIALKKVLTRGGLLIPEDNKELIQQLTMYREDDSKLRTDRIISLALAVWLVTAGKPTNQTATAIAISWM
jgi:hypothetical protein